MDIIETLGIAAIPVLVVIVFVIVEGVKATGIDKKWLPVIAGLTGGILGIVAVYTMPEFPVGDPLSAFAYGAVSGLAATGVHQIFKQFSGDKDPIGTVAVDPETGTIDVNFETESVEALSEKKQGIMIVETYSGKHEAE